MQEFIDWIDKEVDRLDGAIKGKADAAEPEQVPEVLRSALANCVERT